MRLPPAWRRSRRWVAMLRTGDHLICSKDVYAGTVRLFDRIVSGYGIESSMWIRAI